MVAGSKSVPVERCVAIERATGGAVTRQDLRPDDWQDIWPELADKTQPEQPPALALPAQPAITAIAKPGPAETPTPAQHPPRQAPPGAAGADYKPGGWDGVERRTAPEQPCAIPDLERRAPLAAKLAGQGG